MPRGYRDYPPQPGPSLRDIGTGGDDIAGLIMYNGASQADAAARNGALWANTISGIGQGIGDVFAQKAAQNEQKKRSQAIDQLFSGDQMPDAQSIIKVFGPKDGLDVIKGLNAIHPEAKNSYKDRMEQFRDAARGVKALPPDKQAGGWDFAAKSLVAGGVLKPEEVPQFSPEILDQISSYGMAPKEAKTPEGFSLSPGQVRFGPDGKPIASVAAPPQKPDKPEKVAKFWVVRDGKPVRVSEDEYRPGDLPASTREQGRPVTSGDAGRIADLDTSLDDLNALTETIGGSKATGTMAKVGSMLPNAVTEITGWGSDAKQKQATIDRVKQVIGKALEGGVLRKEDEQKYEKILPTIYDPPELVQSKLDGLWKAIQTRRQTQLDSLSDAGYDITKYSARAPRERKAPSNGPATIKTDSDYDALPSGAEFIDPEGKRRRKP